MDDKKITAEELLEALDIDLKSMAQKVADAINNATAGAIIAESEEPVRDANAEFRQRLYQKAIGLLESKQEAFSPSVDSSGQKVEE
jgi:Mg2+/Co2+ transporter CorB